MAHTKVTKNGTQHESGTPNTFSYSGSFDVFKAAEVEVELDNVALTFTTSTINESALPREYTVDYTNKTVHVGGSNLASSNSVVIQPVTDLGKLTNEEPKAKATYQPGASITSADLNNNQLQLMRKALEYDEQKLSSRGGTMTGNLHLGKDVDISFEGDTENAHEITLTVANPTSDKTITFPDTTGTVVTTGDTGTVATAMIAGDAVNGDKIADDAINSEHLADGSVDLVHLSANSVNSSKIVNGSIVADDLASDAVTTVKILDNAVTADKLAHTSVTAGSYTATDLTVDAQGRITAASSGTISESEIANGAVTEDKIGTSAVTTGKIADNAILSNKIAANQITSSEIATTTILRGNLSNNCIGTTEIIDAAVTNPKIAAGAVGATSLGADSVNGSKIADDSIDSEHYVDGSIDSAHIGGSQVIAAKLASNSVTESKITDGNVTTDKIANDAITIGKIGCEQTTISDSDSHIPTSGAVVDYVAAQIAPIGGLEVIADEDNFPTSQPGAGVVISISDAAGIVVNGSGVSTTARTAGNGSDNVTINNFPSSLYSETLASGVGLMVSSTGSSNTYNYHKILAAETDVKQLSDDINDFNARYRVNAGEPSSSLNDGDLVFDTNANKMKVYDATAGAWTEVTSTGDFKFLVPVDAGTTTAATWDGSDTSFDLKETTNSGSAASVNNVNQLIISVNGVIQKPNTGSYSASEEGFYLTDADTIRFCTAPASGSSVFILQIGSAVSIPTPGDGTVSAVKIASGAVTTAKIADDAVDQQKIADNSILNANINSNAAIARTKLANVDVVDDTSPQLGGNLDVNTKNIVFGDSGSASDDRLTFGAGTDLSIYHDGTDNFLTAANGHLNIYGDGTNETHIKAVYNKESIKLIPNLAVELFHNGTKKFETTANGIQIAAQGTGPTIYIEQQQDADSEAIQIRQFGNQNQAATIMSFLNWAGSETGSIESQSGGGGVIDYTTNDNGKFISGNSDDFKIYHSSDLNYIEAATGQGIIFKINGTERAYFHGGDGSFRPWADNTYDLGASGNRWRNIYTGDLNLSNEGSSNDVDNTWGDWTIQEGESDLFLKNNRSGKKYKFNLTEVS